jgi:hypothetical protein
MKYRPNARSFRPTAISIAAGVVLAAGLSLQGCFDDGSGDEAAAAQSAAIKSYSSTPALVDPKLPGVSVYTLISSDDTLPESPSYIFGGSADGSGLMKNSDGTYTFIVNNEDNWSISRISLDKTFKPVKGEYLVNSDKGNSRLCSGTLISKEVQGFGPLYFCGAESGTTRSTYSLAVDPAGAVNTPKYLGKFGIFDAENLLTLPQAAYSGKTVILLTNDNSTASGGQVAIYVSNTVGDLDNGRLYVLGTPDSVTRERALATGHAYDVAFREITDPDKLNPTAMAAAVKAVKPIVFGRVEDIDYGKTGSNRDVYFAVTGQDYNGANADSSRTKYGRVYHLALDDGDPLSGKLELLLDGDDRNGPAKLFQNPDNVCATRNYLYIQEDPNTYGDETHDAYVYQYGFSSKELKVAFEVNHHRGEESYARFNQAKGADGGYIHKEGVKGTWETGALIDISEQVGQDDVFLLSVQPHSWVAKKFEGVDGGTLAKAENQGSQVLIVKGLPR